MFTSNFGDILDAVDGIGQTEYDSVSAVTKSIVSFDLVVTAIGLIILTSFIIFIVKALFVVPRLTSSSPKEYLSPGTIVKEIFLNIVVLTAIVVVIFGLFRIFL